MGGEVGRGTRGERGWENWARVGGWGLGVAGGVLSIGFGSASYLVLGV